MILLEKIILLRGVPLFKGVSNELLVDIAYYTEEERVKSGQILLNEGDIGDILYIIVEGKVAVKKGNRIVAELSSHQTFGELAVLSPAPRSASVVALEESLLLKLGRQQLFYFSFDLEFSMGIITELCERIRVLSKQVSELVKKTEPEV